MTAEQTLAKESKGASRSKQRRASMAAPLQGLNLEMLAQRIRVRAYYLWEGEGCPEGNALEIWLRAEQQALTDMLSK